MSTRIKNRQLLSRQREPARRVIPTTRVLEHLDTRSTSSSSSQVAMVKPSTGFCATTPNGRIWRSSTSMLSRCPEFGSSTSTRKASWVARSGRRTSKDQTCTPRLPGSCSAVGPGWTSAARRSLLSAGRRYGECAHLPGARAREASHPHLADRRGVHGPDLGAACRRHSQRDGDDMGRCRVPRVRQQVLWSVDALVSAPRPACPRTTPVRARRARLPVSVAHGAGAFEDHGCTRSCALLGTLTRSLKRSARPRNQ